jgi:REP element-mobilizing transposase RayT
LYHLTARGNAQQPIFLDDHDRQCFLQVLGKTLSDCNGICHAYCLMCNHYHLLMETPEANLSHRKWGQVFYFSILSVMVLD